MRLKLAGVFLLLLGILAGCQSAIPHEPESGSGDSLQVVDSTQGANDYDPIDSLHYTKSFQGDFPNLHMRETPYNQTLTFYEDWDFDGDGQMDSLFFVGTGGAHLFYYLKLYLSATNSVKEFPSLDVDFPVLKTLSYFKEEAWLDPQPFIQFMILDYNLDELPDIYLCLDLRYPVSEFTKAYHLTSHELIITAKGGKPKVLNFDRDYFHKHFETFLSQEPRFYKGAGK